MDKVVKADSLVVLVTLGREALDNIINIFHRKVDRALEVHTGNFIVIRILSVTGMANNVILAVVCISTKEAKRKTSRGVDRHSRNVGILGSGEMNVDGTYFRDRVVNEGLGLTKVCR